MSDTTDDLDDFAEAMLQLRDQYPNLFVPSLKEWARQVSSYRVKLRRFPIAIVEAACDAAPDEHPDRFPTTGQLVRICTRLQRERREAFERRKRESAEAAENRSDRERTAILRDTIPNDPEGQLAYVSAGATPFEKLARTFEVESKIRNLDPTKKTPPELHQDRMSRFWKTWARQHG
jgi:hypothetical protein